MQIHADYSFEIEVALSGTFQRGRPEQGPSYSSGGEPAEPDMVEDIAIEDIGMVSWVPGTHSWKNPDGNHGRHVTKSILDGVDRTSDAYRTICANILAMIGDEAEGALIEGVSE